MAALADASSVGVGRALLAFDLEFLIAAETVGLEGTPPRLGLGMAQT